MPVAMRYGMTLGELARMANDVLAIGADLVVVPAAGWQRTMAYDETGLPWIKPSPNMPTLESAFHYPGMCLFEGTNLSVGRGTGDGIPGRRSAVARSSGGHRADASIPIPGVDVTPTVFTPITPTDGKYPGVPLQGVRFRVRDRRQYDPTKLAVVLLAAIRAAHPQQFQFRAESFDRWPPDLSCARRSRPAVGAGDLGGVGTGSGAVPGAPREVLDLCSMKAARQLP